MPKTVHITIRLFAAHREAAGTPTLPLEVPEGTTAAAAFDVLCAQQPALRTAAARVAFAVNQTQTTAGHVLHDADELAVLPPMAGG